MSLKKVDPHIFVILGAIGNLTRRKLFPALYHLSAKGVLERSVIIGVDRKPDLDDDSFRVQARGMLEAAGLSVDDKAYSGWCEKCLFYQPIGQGEVEDYRGLAARIEALERERDLPGNRVFYMALPPNVFPRTVTALSEVGLNRSAGWTRIVIEKPFGRDLESAKELNSLVHTCFNESQIYRIDHFLGKETVQNLLVLL